MQTEIKVKVRSIAKKTKGDESLSDVYLRFIITKRGILKFSPEISAGIRVNTKDWKKGRLRGSNDKAEETNNFITDLIAKANTEINHLQFRGVTLCEDYEKEIKNRINTTLTGKVPHGKKAEYESVLAEQTVNKVMEAYLDKSDPCKERRQKYGYALNLLKEHFKTENPIITDITEAQLEEFKSWYIKKYVNTNKHTTNTATTYLAMIAAIFKHAIKTKKILINPLPEKFRGAFVDGNREYLSQEQIFKIINLDDTDLSIAQKKAKYCMLLQCLTGMGYSDMKALKGEHIKYNSDLNKWFIIKKREKNKRVLSSREFTVPLTSRAKFVFDTLKSIAPGTETIFNLATIEYTNKQYKEVGEKAGIIVLKMGTYTFRHTFAVDYMNNGGNLEDLAKMLGHSNTKYTRIYGKISATRLNDAVNNLESKSAIHKMDNNTKKS